MRSNSAAMRGRSSALKHAVGQAPPKLHVLGRRNASRRCADNQCLGARVRNFPKPYALLAAISSSRRLARFQSSSIHPAVRAAHEIERQRRRKQSEGRTDAGAERRDQRRQAQDLRDPVAMHRPGAAEGVHRHAPRIFAALAEMGARRVGHVLVDDLMNAPGDLLGASYLTACPSAPALFACRPDRASSCRRENNWRRDSRARDRRRSPSAACRPGRNIPGRDRHRSYPARLSRSPSESTRAMLPPPAPISIISMTGMRTGKPLPLRNR